jgi:hypothetical protein
MKLLFDQNLSPRLPRLLADIFPDSAHIREFGMRDATDTIIWEYAKANALQLSRKTRISRRAACWLAIHRNSFGCGSGIVPSKRLKICCGTNRWRFTFSILIRTNLT